MRSTSRVIAALLLAIGALAPTVSASAQEFERRQLTIPVRDGAKLYAVALVPKQSTQPLPIILIRTPYSADNAFRTDALPSSYAELAKDGYIFVTEDIRGRYKSEGLFIMNRAQHDPRDKATNTNESTDTYDTIDWLVKNLPNNNGKVGVMGTSYPGWLAGVAGVDAHPALKAISPQAPMTDTWLGDDFFHQGAFRWSFGVEYASSMEFTKNSTKRVAIPNYDHYDYYFQFPTLDSIAKYNGIYDLPSWTGFRTHPAWDAYWQGKAMQLVLTKPEVPILFVGGFWDQEDILGPQLAYKAVEKNDVAANWNHIVLGPWYHGEWNAPGGDSLGSIQFGGPTADYYRENILRPWFAHWLHGTGDGKFAEAYIFEVGENKWHTFDAWPPHEAKPVNIYLGPSGTLSVVSASQPAPSSRPAKAAARSEHVVQQHTAEYDSYVSDPAHPIPYMPRPIDGRGWRSWLVQDQRFVDNRPDVLTWESQPLAQDLTIAGDVTAHLFASTTGSDADWVVKLIDVYPDSMAGDPKMGGYELMVAEDIMRGRYYKSWSKPQAIPPNTVTPFAVDMHEQLYRFKAGHRIMVQVQSSWFPLYDRNPQAFLPNIFDAKPSDFKAQEHRVWHTAKYPSHVAVLVVP